MWLWDQPLPPPLLPGITKNIHQIYPGEWRRVVQNEMRRAPTPDTNARRQQEPQTPRPRHRAALTPGGDAEHCAWSSPTQQPSCG